MRCASWWRCPRPPDELRAVPPAPVRYLGRLRAPAGGGPDEPVHARTRGPGSRRPVVPAGPPRPCAGRLALPRDGGHAPPAGAGPSRHPLAELGPRRPPSRAARVLRPELPALVSRAPPAPDRGHRAFRDRAGLRGQPGDRPARGGDGAAGTGGRRGPPPRPSLDGVPRQHRPARGLVVRHRHQQHVGGARGVGGRRRAGPRLTLRHPPERLPPRRHPGHDAPLRAGGRAPRVRLRARAAGDHLDPHHCGRRPFAGAGAGSRRRSPAAGGLAPRQPRCPRPPARLPALVRGPGRGRGRRLAGGHRACAVQGRPWSRARRRVPGTGGAPRVRGKTVSTAAPWSQPLPFRVLLDEAVRQTRRHLKPIYPAVAFPLALTAAAMPLAQGFLFRNVGGPGAPAPSPRLALVGYAGFGAVMVVWLVVYYLGYGALLVGAVDALAQRPISMGRAWRLMLRPRVLGTLLLCAFAAGLGMMLCVVPGIYLGLLFSLTMPVMVEEGLFGLAAMRRSAELTRYNPQRDLDADPRFKVFVIVLVGTLPGWV